MTGRFSLAGEIAVVTGVLGRLGPIWAEALIEAGATVAALDRPGARPSAAFTELSERVDAGVLRRFDADITDRSSIDAARDAIAERLGTPSILVNNAGIDQPPDSATDRFHIEDMPIDLFRRMVEVNLLGTFQMIQSFGALMINRRRGAIVNIGSLYASVSPDQRFYNHFEGEPPFLKVPAYGASKAAVVNM